MVEIRNSGEAWPALPLEAWEPTRRSLHMWAQIVGKIRLAHAPPMNEMWQSALYVTPRGLTTSPIPHGRRLFELEFDLIDHQLSIRTSEGETRALALWARRTCDFYREVMGVLDSLGLATHVWEKPQEIPDPVPFSRDEHRGYDPASARRFHRVLIGVDRAFQVYRAGRIEDGSPDHFVGKSSPVHFFWGSLDLAVTRFRGRPVSNPPGTDRITRMSYDEELMSVGFWPGSDPVLEPSFYAYARPEPPGFREVALPVDGAYYHPTLGEFLLPYERVRAAADPEAEILAFARSAYAVARTLGGWERGLLERPLDPLQAPATVELH